MWKMIRKLHIVLLLSCWYIGKSDLCFECSSIDSPWCTEYFDQEDITAYFNNVVNCSNRFCMKLIGHVKGKSDFYVRTCDMTWGIPGTCVTSSHVLAIPTSTVCVCRGSRCNTGNQSNEQAGKFMLLPVLFLVYFRFSPF